MRRRWLIVMVAAPLASACGVSLEGGACLGCASFVSSSGDGDGDAASSSLARVDGSTSSVLADGDVDVVDAGAVDADADAGVPDAGPSLVECTPATCGASLAVCPPGRPCRVRCVGAGACEGVACAEGMPCAVECADIAACRRLFVYGSQASRVCLRLLGDGDAGDGRTWGDVVSCGLPAAAGTCSLECANGNCGNVIRCDRPENHCRPEACSL